VLGINRIEAVPLHFTENGTYSGFDADYPTTRNGGKPEIISKIKNEQNPDTIVMIGDGASDLETQPTVNKFIGYLGYTTREKVQQEAHHRTYLLSEIIDILM
jgi:phosphoserine phosphatase